MSTRRLVLSILFWPLVIGLFTLLGAVMGPAAHANSDHFVAATENGPVRGLQTETMKNFLGIPYAAPPVGDLRWRPPQPAAPWKGVRDATQFANHCPQPPSPFGLASVTEDCLYLNVYTPAGGWHKGKGKPVMVWIHGGALYLGESNDYDPVNLVEKEDVVVVTINYRLGILGYLAHPALTLEQGGASGNYGFMDQQAALQWVQRNIKNFGGDPDNVTIFGESAGGLSVHTQLVSPLAAGLFDRAIIESGAYQLNTASLVTAEGRGSAFATRAGCGAAADVAACLRALTQPQDIAMFLADPGAGAIAAPNVDGRVLTQTIGAALLSGEFNRVPVMEGSNHDEWRLFVAIYNDLTPAGPLTAANYVPQISSTLGVSIPVATFIANTYYPLANYSSPDVAMGAVGTDAIFACNSRKSIRLMAYYVPVFAYEFNDPNPPQLFLPPVSFPYGAYHASEIQYVFNLRPAVPNPPALDANQELLSHDMVHYWGHFARFGDPNSSLTEFWPQYKSGDDKFQSLNLPHPTTESGFAADHQCSVWP